MALQVRTVVPGAVTLYLLLHGVTASASAQGPAQGTPTLGAAAVAVVSTVLVGWLFVAYAPEYTDRVTSMAVRQPGGVLLFGTVVVLFVGTNLLVLLTLLSQVLPDSLAIAVAVVVGVPVLLGLVALAQFGVLTVGQLLADRWESAVMTAGFLGAVLVLVGVPGRLVAGLLSTVGVGAGLLAYEARDDEGRRPRNGAPRTERRTDDRDPEER